MKIAFIIVTASLGFFVYSSSEEVGCNLDPLVGDPVPLLRPAKKTEPFVKVESVPGPEIVTFDEYIARRKSSNAANERLNIDPRWEFSPRKALDPLGKVHLVFAMPASESGARRVRPADEELVHFGLTVWNVEAKVSKARLGVACIRLVDSVKQATPVRAPAVTPYVYWGRLSSKDRILGTQDLRICGDDVRLTHYHGSGQCNVPHLENWLGEFAAGGWGVYLNASFPEGSNVEAVALDVIQAADRITDSLRTARTNLDRPTFSDYRFEEIRWGNRKATFVFSLPSCRGKEICANLWNRVPKQVNYTGIKGYGTRIIQVGGKGRIFGEATASCPIRGEAFQLDWANEFGIGGSILHEIKVLPTRQ